MTAPELSAEQRMRVEYLATDEWVVDTGSADDDARSWNNFDRTLAQMSSVELHHFACNFNWDCGVKELHRVIEHPECDAGTALTIYWLGQPLEYYEMEAPTEAFPGADEIVGLFRKIEDMIGGERFKESQISCDPSNILGQSMLRGSTQERELIPDQMFQKRIGMEVKPLIC